MSRDRSDATTHVAALRELLERDDWQLLAQLYGYLSAIDGKSASLLNFNALVTAGVFVMMSLASHYSPVIVISAIVILCETASSLFLLAAIPLFWASDTDPRSDSLAADIIRRRDRRSRCYRVAWVIAIATLPLMICDLGAVVWRLLSVPG